MHDHLGLIVVWSAPGIQRSQKPIESFPACLSHTNGAAGLVVANAAVFSTMRLLSEIILFSVPPRERAASIVGRPAPSLVAVALHALYRRHAKLRHLFCGYRGKV